jgi:hypothetical protein
VPMEFVRVLFGFIGARALGGGAGLERSPTRTGRSPRLETESLEEAGGPGPSKSKTATTGLPGQTRKNTPPPKDNW